MDILEEIFDNIIGKIEFTEDFNSYEREYDNCYNELCKGLSEEQTKLLLKLCQEQNGLQIEYGVTAFKRGFKCAFELFIECLT